jgi:hypothetical protein
VFCIGKNERKRILIPSFLTPSLLFNSSVFLLIPSVIILESMTLSRLCLPTALGVKTIEAIGKSPSFFYRRDHYCPVETKNDLN